MYILRVEDKVKEFRRKFFLGYVFDAFRSMALVLGEGESQEQRNEGWGKFHPQEKAE